MTDPAALPPYAPASTPPPPPQFVPRSVRKQQQRSRNGWVSRQDLRAGFGVVVVLAVLGAVLGVLWQWWSPPGPRGYVIKPGSIQPDETEAFVAADGRFAVIAVCVGLVAAIMVWRRRRMRGPVAVAALGLGGLAGSQLMAVVGQRLGGGTKTGRAGTVISELPLSLHTPGLLVLEGVVAVLVYSMFVSFAVDDDLGRSDPGADSRG